MAIFSLNNRRLYSRERRSELNYTIYFFFGTVPSVNHIRIYFFLLDIRMLYIIMSSPQQLELLIEKFIFLVLLATGYNVEFFINCNHHEIKSGTNLVRFMKKISDS